MISGDLVAYWLVHELIDIRERSSVEDIFEIIFQIYFTVLHIILYERHD